MERPGRARGLSARALAVAGLGAVALAGGGGPSFVDVAPSLGLVYTTDAGGTFGGTSDIQSTMQRNMGHGAAVGDYDADGDLDVYVLGGLGQPNALFRNDLDQGTPGFTDVTLQAGVGLDDRGLSRVAHFVDLDEDGHLDLLWLNDSRGPGQVPVHVFAGDGQGGFTDVTPGSGLDAYGLLKGGASLADYDRDGLLDLYVAHWSMSGGNPTGQFQCGNLLYRNLGGFRFEDVTAAAGLDGLTRDSFTAIFHDLDGDHDPDLYVAVDHSSDELYRNDDGVFVRVTEAAGTTHIGNDMGAACADLDDDGDLDIFATNITDSVPPCGFGTTQGNVLYMSGLAQGQGLAFSDEASARGVFDTAWGWGVELTDVENDGDLDLLAVTGFDEYVLSAGALGCELAGTPPYLYLNDGSAHFTRELARGLPPDDDSRGLIAFDFDRDGDQDYLVTNVRGPVRLLENRTPAAGNALHVRLHQRAGLNANGIGASVWAQLGARRVRREVLAGESYLSGTPAEVHLGLGERTAVDVLRVRWTDGSWTTLFDVPAGGVLDVDQPACWADWVPDGVLDDADIAAFFADWLADDLRTDVNGTWDCDPRDVSAFLRAHTAGCP